LIPYFTMALIIGFPMFTLETSIGQLTKKDMIGAWKMMPISKGVGWAAAIALFVVNTYYTVVLTWLARYMVASFSAVLPWTHCDNAWNTPQCHLYTTDSSNTTSNVNSTSIELGSTTPIEEFWENEVLTLSADVYTVGGINWSLFTCLLIMWIVIYFCIWKGIKWTAKILYFTVPVPFLLLFVVLIRGLTLDGAADGIWFFIKPDLTKLASSEVWMNAAEQVCFSYTLCNGVITTLSSHNRIHHNFLRSAMVIIGLNIFTSITSGFAVFSIIGFMAKTQNTTVDMVAQGGPGLAFVVYPQALSLLPCPQLWSVLFFAMMLLLSLDSEFEQQECLCQAIRELLPKRYRSMKYSNEITIGVTTFIMFLISITMVTEGGYYVFQIFEFGGSGWCYIFIATYEALAIGWCFGGHKYADYLEKMLGCRSIFFSWFIWCWKLLVPVTGITFIVMSFAQYKPLSYSDGTQYPLWSELIAWSISLASILIVPICSLYVLITTPGNFNQRLEVTCALSDASNDFQLEFESSYNDVHYEKEVEILMMSNKT